MALEGRLLLVKPNQPALLKYGGLPTLPQQMMFPLAIENACMVMQESGGVAIGRINKVYGHL